jgi:hypothetical protein
MSLTVFQDHFKCFTHLFVTPCTHNTIHPHNNTTLFAHAQSVPVTSTDLSTPHEHSQFRSHPLIFQHRTYTVSSGHIDWSFNTARTQSVPVTSTDLSTPHVHSQFRSHRLIFQHRTYTVSSGHIHRSFNSTRTQSVPVTSTDLSTPHVQYTVSSGHIHWSFNSTRTQPVPVTSTDLSTPHVHSQFRSHRLIFQHHTYTASSGYIDWSFNSTCTQSVPRHIRHWIFQFHTCISSSTLGPEKTHDYQTSECLLGGRTGKRLGIDCTFDMRFLARLFGDFRQPPSWPNLPGEPSGDCRGIKTCWPSLGCRKSRLHKKIGMKPEMANTLTRRLTYERSISS